MTSLVQGNPGDSGRPKVLVDMGYYQWEADTSSAGDEEDGGQTKQVLHLVQVQGHSLAARLRLFPWPLPAATGEGALLKQVLPGYWDAPGGDN